ncbi:MaoC/PaaZ C-terminal domain-containing protein [Streptomyces meridianus]|uniref:MaoC-like domain-containing protein n=1 Tax=Streptomyces meridianus TaxID=2938945 RepID=A0ABT0X7E7_9ACTN|nr:MaoC/PaaZ C-terminal domain-containing protein [Streptomyces meridianus]MCM2578339.1 hypothetical protein [Streptomyces meridianus]
MNVVRLQRSPLLMPALARGALNGLGKRPRPDGALPPTRIELPCGRLDLGRLAAYARVCGYPRTDPLPITYPHILGFPAAARLMGDRTFPLPLLGLVHTSIEITQWAPLHAEDPLELAVYADGLRPHRKGTEVVMVTEVRRAGELVWQDRSAYLARGRSDVPGSPPPGPGAQASPSAPEPLPARTAWPLGADLGRRHAAVSGDWNPIHLYPWTARALGFPRTIAHGMWTIARCLAEREVSGEQPVRVHAEFRKPVLLPATVTLGSSGHSFDVRSGPDCARLHLTGEVVPAVDQAPA